MLANCYKYISRILPAALVICGSALAFVACEDDFNNCNGGMPEGTGTISLNMEFAPMAAALDKGRAAETAGGKALNGIDDMCILFYDTDGNLLEDYVYYYNSDASKKPAEIPDDRFFSGSGRFKNVPRSDADASNNHNAQEESMQGEFDMIKIPYGNYYIIGVANLGNLKSEKYTTETTTYKELFSPADKNNSSSTLEGIRKWRLEWDASLLANNAEMFGCFSTDQTSSEAANLFSAKELPTALVNRNGLKFTAWLRRAASKVTIAFDGEKLRDNIWIHLKSATVKDIPVSCDLGRQSMVTDSDSLINESGQSIDYTYGLEATQTTSDGGKYNTNWETITRGIKYPAKEEDRHTESELSLFFYENMQGIGRDKRQYPELGPDGNPTGNVADNTIQKDDKPCGTYIEVTAFYRSRDMVVSNGDIIYRFMLGKDEKTDYNAERNYHYRLTLQFNGKANDYDWHIDYDEEPGIKTPIPYYYVPYMYNQQMYYPVTIVGEITGELRAEITRSDWGPYNPETESAPSASEYTYYTKKVVNDGPWHGFLSLRQAPMETAENGERIYKAAIGSHTNYLSTYNEEYWKGNGNASLGEKVSHRGIRYYNTDGTPVSEKGSENASDSINDGAYQVSQTIVNGVKHTTFLIPLYSREINLIKTSGFRGNNPYIGYYRYAEITFTATVNGKEQKNIAKILQVPRIVNPKGIYRSYNCVDPFNVHLMKLDHENDPTYTPVKSTGGPWSAEIEFMEGSGWLSVGGKTTVGSKIHGYTDSDIEFDVNFLSKLSNPDDVRCAIIKVLYHNYTCTHRIMVRQGYAPVNLTTGGTKNSKWHVSNLEYVENVSGNLIAHEEESPRGEGSMFKRGNYLTAIASQNNKLENQGKGLATFNLAPYSPADKNPKQSKWGDITSNRNSTLPQANFKLPESSTTCHVASFEDFEDLRKHCDFGAGILYGDGATKTQTMRQ